MEQKKVQFDPLISYAVWAFNVLVYNLFIFVHFNPETYREEIKELQERDGVVGWLNTSHHCNLGVFEFVFKRGTQWRPSMILDKLEHDSKKFFTLI